ncbi:MAG: MazG nucleotide pyrophosphohydrolase domain-containing protein, partial [Sphingomonadaceae bacterium]
SDVDARTEEFGDLLFAVVNWARHHGIDAEAALRGANAKFERRFRAMEDMAGAGFAGLDLAGKDVLWDRAKAAERETLNATGSAPNPLRRA